MERKIQKLALGLAFGLSFAFGLTLPQFVGAEAAQAIGPFGGINNTDNPLVIPANQAQDLLNVDITPGGKSVKRRKGYGLQFNLAVTTSATHGVYSFFDANGNEVSLYFHDRYGQASVAGATPTTLFSTGSLAATWQCVDSLGFAYCASSSRDPIIKTNGVTATPLSGSPIGTIVAVTPERLLVAGTAANPQRIAFSKANDYTTWTVGGQPTDPNTEDINAPGSRVTHVTYAFGKIIWFKDASFGAILGTDNANWQIITISPTIGTLDNTSVYRDGILQFRGQDGHIYGFDGAVPVKLTRDLGDTISASAARRANSYSETSQAEFQAGQIVPSGYLSTTITAGAVLLSTSIALVNSPGFEDGPNNVTNTVTNWTVGGTGVTITARAAGGVVGCNGGTLSPYSGTYYLFANSAFGTTVEPRVELLNASNDSTITYVSIPTTEQCGWAAKYLVHQSSVGASVKIRVSRPTQSDGTKTVTSNSFVWPGALSFVYQSTSSLSNPYFAFDYFITAPSTGVYYSAVHNAANLTSWDTLSATMAENDASIDFFMRSSTNTFTVLSSTPSWTSQTVGNLITISTGTYFQARADFSITAPTQTPTLNDFTVNWFEGAASDKAYAVYHDNAIWWSAAVGVGVSTNNYVLRNDLINQTWTLYDIGTNGMLVRNNALYFGSSSAGKIFKFGDADSDNGSAINSYWKSKDFFGDSPFTEKEYRTLSISAASVANSTMTVTYTINGSSATSYNFTNYDANSSFIKHNKNLPLARVGSYLNVKVGDNSTNAPWEVFGIQYTFEPKPWRPTP